MNPASNESENIVDFLSTLHDNCLDLSKQLRFDKTNAYHFALISLYGSLIEFVGCMLTLLKNNCKIGVPTLFRTFLETYVEFYNLSRDPKYGYHIDANDLKEWLKMLKAARDTNNSYLTKISSFEGLHDLINQKEKELEKLKARGYGPIDICSRFKRADMLDVYQSIYNSMCVEAHSNKRALIGRHADVNNGQFEMIYYKNAPDESYLTIIDSSSGLLVAATQSIHENLKSSAFDQIEQFWNRLETIRATYKE